MSCGIGSRHSSYLVLLWPRLAAVALIQPLAWELPHSAGEVLKSKGKKKKKGLEAGELAVRIAASLDYGDHLRKYLERRLKT